MIILHHGHQANSNIVFNSFSVHSQVSSVHNGNHIMFVDEMREVPAYYKRRWENSFNSFSLSFPHTAWLMDTLITAWLPRPKGHDTHTRKLWETGSCTISEYVTNVYPSFSHHDRKLSVPSSQFSFFSLDYLSILKSGFCYHDLFKLNYK